jgi:S1-C subfamily serine protease
MRKVPLYSSSGRAAPPQAADALAAPSDDSGSRSAAVQGRSPVAAAPRASWSGALRRGPLLGFASGAALVALVVGVRGGLGDAATRQFTQRDIDAAVLHTLETKTLPSPAARAYEAVRRSVVLVRGEHDAASGAGDDVQRTVGSGVVIVDSGIILTNLHVVAGAGRIKVRFEDGTDSEASVVSVQPENDLAVLQAKTLPDDLQAATMRSTGDLAPGDQVVAVGFPFAIGPSVSAGVISGLRRDYTTPQGKRVLTNLIQFDAAANPGNSGGPLVTMDGEVVGIVTAILNPGEQGTFIGIAFAVPIENAASGAGLAPF